VTVKIFEDLGQHSLLSRSSVDFTPTYTALATRQNLIENARVQREGKRVDRRLDLLGRCGVTRECGAGECSTQRWRATQRRHRTLLIDVGDEVANIGRRRERLLDDVGARQNLVDCTQHAGNVLVNVENCRRQGETSAK
jgi:hypothetical protein